MQDNVYPDTLRVDIGKSEYNVMYDVMLPIACQLLEKHWEFYPFGAAVDKDGKVLLKLSESIPERPDPETVARDLQNALKSDYDKREFRACAVCVNVTMIPPQREKRSDALQFTFDARDGKAVDLFVPYIVDNSRQIAFDRAIMSNCDPK